MISKKYSIIIKKILTALLVLVKGVRTDIFIDADAVESLPFENYEKVVLC